MTKSEFLQIVNDYNGTITDNGDKVTISANNIISAHYADGTVFKKTKALCTISFVESNDTLTYDEKTYAVLGGGCQSASKETLLSLLERYNFQRKKLKQMELFDDFF